MSEKSSLWIAIEDRIDVTLIEEFYNCRNIWKKSVSNERLFHFWKKIRNESTVTHKEDNISLNNNDDTLEANMPEYNGISNIELEVDNSVWEEDQIIMVL